MKILRFTQLQALLGLSRSTIWRRSKYSDFPKPIKLGHPGRPGAVAWDAIAVDAWLIRQKKIAQKTAGGVL